MHSSRSVPAFGLFGNLNLIAFNSYDTTFVVAITGSSGTTDYWIAIGKKEFGKVIYGLFASQTKCNMNITSTGKMFLALCHAWFIHNF